MQRHSSRLLATIVAAGLTLTACSTDNSTESQEQSGNQQDTAQNGEQKGEGNGEGKQQSPAAETAGPSPRLVTTYDGGLLTLDAKTLEVLDNTELDGFNRLNPLGDGRTLLVSVQDGFRVFDAGAWTEPHGDHTHSYATEPLLTDFTYSAEKPGHVVNHGKRTLIFGDGDGSIQELNVKDFRKAYKKKEKPEVVKNSSVEPHHGVAVPLDDGGMLRTEGTEDERHTVLVEDREGKEVAKSEKCPGVHGEAPAQGGALVVGCQDGVLVYKNGKFTKVDSPDSYGRVGNQKGSPESPIILGDYKSDKKAKDEDRLERPTKISLTDTRTNQLRLVDLGASYSFRSLERGPAGEALVLTDDGKLQKIDPNTGEIQGSYPVAEPWKEPEEWQEARPTLFVLGDYAYVTEPSSKKLHKVNITTGKVEKSTELPESPNEISGVKG